MDLVLATNITEAQHMISLTSYYRIFFQAFSNMMQSHNEMPK